MEYENKYGSKAVSGTALGIGIGALGLEVLRGGLGGILGGGNASCDHDAALRSKISELETEVKLRDAFIYSDTRLNEFRNYVDSKFDGVNAAICQQNVYNATNTAAINCINGQIAVLMGLTKTVIPFSSICPTPAAAPTATT